MILTNPVRYVVIPLVCALAGAAALATGRPTLGLCLMVPFAAGLVMFVGGMIGGEPLIPDEGEASGAANSAQPQDAAADEANPGEEE